MANEKQGAPAGASTQTSIENPVAAPAAVVQPPAAPVAAPAPAAAATQEPTPPAQDPNWIKPRLERERSVGERKLLERLGFANEADAKAAAAAAKAAAEANKSAEQKALEASQAAAAEKARADAQHAVLSEHAARQMVGLTPEQQTAVKAVAGDDPVKQLQTIGALQPTWSLAAASAAAAATAAAQAAASAARPTTTAPPADAPNGGAPPAPSARATYDALRSSNPFAAARHGSAHPEVYTPKT